MAERKITMDWAFNSEIIWIRELAELIKIITKNVPAIILQTMDAETLNSYLFVLCVSNKVNLLSLKHSKDFDEMMNRAFINQRIRDAGKDEHYSNNYELDKTLTKKYLESEIESLRIKCENKDFKSKVNKIEKEKSELFEELTFMNRILEIAQTKIKKKKREAKELTFDSAIKLNPDFKKIVFSNAEKCRYINGKINASKLGRMFGVDHKTAKSWCIKLNIPLKRQVLN